MPTMTPDRLLAGLDAIAASLAAHPDALALMALGSCGAEMQRLDAYSDLDFFVIVKPHAKQDFITNLDWLTTGAPRVFAHRNTVDGWKSLDADGVFCEFAVFHVDELANIPFAGPRIIWSREGFDTGPLVPRLSGSETDINWCATEAATNILIGLKRLLRGEKLSAHRALVTDAGELVAKALRAEKQSDRFNPWRRMEADDPKAANTLNQALTAPDLAETARSLLALVSGQVVLPQAILDEINTHLDMCDAR